MIWNAGVSIKKPDMAVKLVSGNDNEKPAKGFFRTVADWFMTEEALQARDTMERVKKSTALTYTGGAGKAPTADPAPTPLVYGNVKVPGSTVIGPKGSVGSSPRKYDLVCTWRGEPMTPTQLHYDPAPDMWRPHNRRSEIPAVPDGWKVFEEFTVEEWNDMTEEEREEHIKKRALGAIGIAMSENDAATPAERHMRRMEARAKADRLKAEMEAHKRKLEKELEEAEKVEEHYQNNQVFGAF